MFDVFYLDRPTGLWPHEQPATSIEHARELSRTRYLWVVTGLNCYSGFDWSWEPPPWQSQQMHVWPSQHQENGGTYLIPRMGHDAVNRDHPMILRTGSAQVLHVKHHANGEDQGDANTRFISDYLGTLKRALAKVDWTWCWITSDVCDYRGFDWTWHPSEWQDKMLHVWASDDQRFGDTFYVHVPTFLERSRDLALLEWFDTINFIDRSVPRWRPPVVQYATDSVVPAVWQHDFQTPVVQFSRYDPVLQVPAVNLWRQETRAVMPLRPGSESVLIPRDAKNHLNTQIYDYAVIERGHDLSISTPLDIVFISNGEPNAEENWERLQEVTGDLPNQVHRLTGVDGRVAAYQSAARLSQTDWFFAVFAKLYVSGQFDWSWQPDRLQEAKHYIFHARNDVTGLTYGHQAMIAYNRRLTLENPGLGLDFTLDQPHTVVPEFSGVANYAFTPWIAWRTAFREAIKLRHSLPDVENQFRLDRWLTQGHGLYGAFSMMGAQDAMEYYEQVAGDFNQLKKSYEWSWLAAYASVKRPQLFTESNT